MNIDFFDIMWESFLKYHDLCVSTAWCRIKVEEGCMPNASCLGLTGEARGKSVPSVIAEREEFEIVGGCPVNGQIQYPVTVRKLAEAGVFNPNSVRCRKCRKNANYRRCMPIYDEMTFDEKMRIDAIIDSLAIEVKHSTVDCPHRTPIAAA